METIIDRVRNLKAQAMVLRDKEQFDEARNLLGKAAQELEAAMADEKKYRPPPTPAGEFERKLAAQLVHIRGSIGGVWRRETSHHNSLSAYDESIRAYDEGYLLERSESEYRIIDSYTLVQRLVARVLKTPVSACQENSVNDLDVRKELRHAADVIQKQIARQGREKDEYAASDLAVVLLLLGDNDWRPKLQRFLDLKPDYAITATRELLVDLEQRACASGHDCARLCNDLNQALKMLS